jgi:molybdenum cofactor biosynthesis protein A
MLIDRFNRKHTYLRISVTDRCNFRCVYCMPAAGIAWREREEILTFEEIERLARIFVRLGVDKIRLTGGEPTVRKNLEHLVERLAALQIKSLLMTTNGYVLPEKAALYRNAGVTGLNVSLDTLREDRFRQITRTTNFGRVMQGIDAALEAGFDSVKINMVVMKGVNEDELLDFVELAREKPVTVRFIEFMPFRDNGWHKGDLYPYRQMLEDIQAQHKIAPLPGEASAVGKDWMIEGFAGTIGFVTSMTDSFCGGCNRVRLTADGQIKSCLFSPAEQSLRDLMRAGVSDDELEKRIRLALWMKPKEHPPMEQLLASNDRSMIEIGG